jgi:hypothetical protein
MCSVDTKKSIEEKKRTGRLRTSNFNSGVAGSCTVHHIITINFYTLLCLQLRYIATPTREGLDGCRDNVSPTDVSPNENSCIMLRLYYLSLGLNIPVPCVPTLDHMKELIVTSQFGLR